MIDDDDDDDDDDGDGNVNDDADDGDDTMNKKRSTRCAWHGFWDPKKHPKLNCKTNKCVWFLTSRPRKQK